MGFDLFGHQVNDQRADQGGEQVFEQGGGCLLLLVGEVRDPGKDRVDDLGCGAGVERLELLGLGDLFVDRLAFARQAYSRTLRTGNRQEACRRVVEMQARGRRGEPDLFAKSISVDAGLDEFMEVCRNRGLGPKTLDKYDLTVRGVNSTHAPRDEGDRPPFGRERTSPAIGSSVCWEEAWNRAAPADRA